MSRDEPAASLRFATIPDPTMAIGVAVRFMMNEPAYASMPFGPWASALMGQIDRGHYGFVLNGDNEVVGFVGWALAEESKAQEWYQDRLTLSNDECREGNCVIFNSLIAKSTSVYDFIWTALRAAMTGKKYAYYRRAYADGRIRPVRVTVEDVLAKGAPRDDRGQDQKAEIGLAVSSSN